MRTLNHPVEADRLTQNAGPAQRPLRVCFLIDDLATGGTESQLVALIQHLDRRRVRPYLVLLRGDGPLSRTFEPDCCPVMRLGVPSLASRRAARQGLKFIRFLRQERIDVVQTYFPDSSYFGLVAAWLAGVPHRVRTRNNSGHWVTRGHRLLGRALNLVTTASIANCRAARDTLIADEQPRPDSVVVLENGVDLERFLRIAPPGEHARRVGAVSNLRPVKGVDVLVAAAARLREDFPDLEFAVAGEGGERGHLQEQIHAGGLRGAFHLCGDLRDIPGFLAGLDIAVLASRAEGMPNAVLEYMAAARPIVATTVGATPELIRDGVEGLLVPPGNAAELAGAITRLVVDRQLARRLGESARRRARDCYSRAAMVQRFEEFYTGLRTY